MSSVMILHIGPVQGFILSARRSRDLWFSSWLLSELAKSAARAIALHEGGSLVFPAPKDLADLGPGSSLKVANRIVALIDGEPAAVISAVETAIRERLDTITKETLDYIDSNGAKDYDRERTLAQIHDLPEVLWVAQPLAETPEAYPIVRQYLEALLAARKSTREFVQPGWAAEEPKSSLDGQRESVILERAYPLPNATEDERRLKSQRLYRWFRARPAERLSGVDLLKRVGNPSVEALFPSTSHMAALPLIIRLARDAKDVAELARTYVNKLEVLEVDAERLTPRFARSVLGGRDGSILFRSRITEMLETEEERQKAIDALTGFLSATNSQEPSPYYALLVGDGDFMGSVIDAQRSPGAHRSFSQRLSQFAEGVLPLVEDAHDGALVYAGGDDVLAFLPLHSALQCAKALSDRFAQDLAGFQDSEGRRPSFSAGLVIAHHLDPLSDVMRLARNAERTAKQLDGKNALAVTLSKRSGADRTIVGRWETLYPRLEQLIRLLQDAAFPSSVAYDLRELALRLSGAERFQANLGDLLYHESVRILKRKRDRHSADKLPESLVADLLRPIMELKSVDALIQFAQEIITSQVLAEAGALVYGSTARSEKGEVHESVENPTA